MNNRYKCVIICIALANITNAGGPEHAASALYQPVSALKDVARLQIQTSLGITGDLKHEACFCGIKLDDSSRLLMQYICEYLCAKFDAAKSGFNKTSKKKPKTVQELHQELRKAEERADVACSEL